MVVYLESNYSNAYRQPDGIINQSKSGCIDVHRFSHSSRGICPVARSASSNSSAILIRMAKGLFQEVLFNNTYPVDRIRLSRQSSS